MGRAKLLQSLMALSLVFNIFTDFTLTAKAAIESQSISSHAESVNESLISEIEAASEMVSEDSKLLTEVEVDGDSGETDSVKTELDDLGQVNGDQEIEVETSDLLESVELEEKDLTVSEEDSEVLNTVEEEELISTSVDEVDEDEGDISLLNDEIMPLSSNKTGLVQLWQVVPDGQTQEGKTTSQIMAQLQCKPNHNLYPLSGAATQDTYVNSCYVDDALYLGEDSQYYYIYLSGYEGKVLKSQSHYFDLDLNGDGKKVTYEIQTVAYFIPDAQVNTRAALSEEEYTEPQDAPYLNYETDHLEKYSDVSADGARAVKTVQSPSYYANEGGNLVHYITNNVTKSNNYSKVIVGKAPGWMKTNVKYYSYDGVYFYNKWQDIKVNGNGAVNASNPFYNYYQYLPFRSTTNYTANSFDSYTLNNGGAGGSLVNTGQYFISAQSQFGTNAALQYAMGIHESGWGLSSLSLNKNNLFGMNATDSNPYGNGTSFPSVSAGIYYHADRYISWGYTDPVSDWRYFGAHVGNKGSGMNVKYASDPFWGEKIAGWYYRFDNANGLKDYNYYTIGIKQSNTVVDIKSQASSSATTLYQTKNKKSNLKFGNYPVLIIGEQNGYYRIQTDTPIVNGVPSYSATYNWDTSRGYIPKNAIDYVNKELTGWIKDSGVWYYYKNGQIQTGWQKVDNKWYYLDNEGRMKTGWLHLNNKWYYLNATGEMQVAWKKINNVWYYFNSNGEMQTGWLQLDSKKYYLNSSGAMQTGWQKIDNKWYYFYESGSMAKGWVERPEGWYYMNTDGVMQTGWKTIGGKKYYFYSSGLMATNTAIDGYKIDANGVATKSK
ncbi:MAG: glucosaminidase domain-containing protein [Turicibacter sp.]|nr:glucosaminidase domain-containing protein [Turicibacter sp.]